MEKESFKSKLPPCTVVVPTFEEAVNIPGLVSELDSLRSSTGLQLNLLIMDDDSQDGTSAVVGKLCKPWVRLVTRRGGRGLSQAVLEGIELAQNRHIVVMDGDLSHPAEVIPAMLMALENNYDFAIGSRYISGATTDLSWGLFRWLNSKVATLLAYPLSDVTDPMSGFFALTKETFECAPYLNPVGYKVGLELLVKCTCNKVKELPIHFSKRVFGKSKLTLKQQLLYLQHLRRLYLFKYAEHSHLAQFLIVGGTGVIVNLMALTCLNVIGASPQLAIAGGIGVSFISNFLLNNRFTFSYTTDQSLLKKGFGFVAACSLGAAMNFLTAITLLETAPVFSDFPQLAAICGIGAGMIFNYLLNRYLVFKKQLIPPS